MNRRIAERIRAGESLVGVVVKIPGAAMVETAGLAGFDLVVIDAEHGAGDTALLEDHLRAASAAGIAALVRVGRNGDLEVLRALDAGAAGIVVPHVDDAAAAEQAVTAAYYPPRGRRGLATSTRAGRYGLTSLAAHVRRANDATVVIVQVEDVAAVPHARAIADVPGVDAVFLGPTDLSMSLGRPGDVEHPDVADAIDRVVAGVGDGDAGLCVFAPTVDSALGWRRKGAQIVLFGGPAILSHGFRQIVGAVKDGPPATPDSPLQVHR
ncbi:HpcH/HpaI aldolase family protein [Patulibacter defluvii]|uniref:HpcH/HpaI aldolase family protein n=1 Tax=Patulibacter defluvii TaxID=3095358 RepID=UPI002A74C890|nr:aldolase/citrate lyase family protein [Patulibacter sp. DM4]